MWWLVPIAVVGAAAAIYSYFDGEAQVARSRWENQRETVIRTVAEHRRNIEKNLERAQASYDFKLLTDLHFSSHRVADSAYKLLNDARTSLDVMGRMLKDAKTQRDKYFTELKTTKDLARRRVINEEIDLLNGLRAAVFPDKDSVKQQRDDFQSEVLRLNEQTRILRGCGIG